MRKKVRTWKESSPARMRMRKTLPLLTLGWLLIVAACVNGCGVKTLRINSCLSNPCPDYPDLLLPIYERHADPSGVNPGEEYERGVCLQGWLKKCGVTP